MLVVGDHKQTDRVYKYTEYKKENQSIIKSKSTKRKLIRIENKQRINYNEWFKTLPKDRITYLKRIGITDLKKIKILIHINYNLLPYDVRRSLQTK